MQLGVILLAGMACETVLPGRRSGSAFAQLRVPPPALLLEEYDGLRRANGVQNLSTAVLQSE
jgi:hypothetical protein